MSCNCAGGRCGIDHEFRLASCDIVRIVDQYGGPVTVRFHKETTIDRDRYNDIINRKENVDAKLWNAFPIQYSPTDKQKTNAGIKENTDVIIWIPTIKFIDVGYTIDDLNTIKADVIIGNKTFEIVDKSYRDQFGLNYLYVVLGLNER